MTAIIAALAQAHGTHRASRPAAPSPDELAAFERAKPAFERHCFRCHTIAGKKSKRKALTHLAMDRYPFSGHHAGEAGSVVRKVLGAGGTGKVTMPSDDPGAVTGDDLARILAWADAFHRAHPTNEDKNVELHAH